jgi:hypothetical protein
MPSGVTEAAARRLLIKRPVPKPSASDVNTDNRPGHMLELPE